MDRDTLGVSIRRLLKPSVSAGSHDHFCLLFFTGDMNAT